MPCSCAPNTPCTSWRDCSHTTAHVSFTPCCVHSVFALAAVCPQTPEVSSKQPAATSDSMSSTQPYDKPTIRCSKPAACVLSIRPCVTQLIQPFITARDAAVAMKACSKKQARKRVKVLNDWSFAAGIRLEGSVSVDLHAVQPCPVSQGGLQRIQHGLRQPASGQALPGLPCHTYSARHEAMQATSLTSPPTKTSPTGLPAAR